MIGTASPDTRTGSYGRASAARTRAIRSPVPIPGNSVRAAYSAPPTATIPPRTTTKSHDEGPPPPPPPPPPLLAQSTEAERRKGGRRRQERAGDGEDHRAQVGSVAAGAQRIDPGHRGERGERERNREQEQDDPERGSGGRRDAVRGNAVRGNAVRAVLPRPGAPLPAKSAEAQRPYPGAQGGDDERGRQLVPQQVADPGGEESQQGGQVGRMPAVVELLQVLQQQGPAALESWRLREQLPLEGRPVTERDADGEQRGGSEQRRPGAEPGAEASFVRGRGRGARRRRQESRGDQDRGAEEDHAVLDERAEEEADSEQEAGASVPDIPEQADDQQCREQGVEGILADLVGLDDGAGGEGRQGPGEECRPAGYPGGRQQEQQRGDGERAAEGREETDAESGGVDFLDQPERERVQDRGGMLRRGLLEDFREGTLRPHGDPRLVYPQRGFAQTVEPERGRGDEREGGGDGVTAGRASSSSVGRGGRSLRGGHSDRLFRQCPAGGNGRGEGPVTAGERRLRERWSREFGVRWTPSFRSTGGGYRDASAAAWVSAMASSFLRTSSGISSSGRYATSRWRFLLGRSLYSPRAAK